MSSGKLTGADIFQPNMGFLPHLLGCYSEESGSRGAGNYLQFAHVAWKKTPYPA